MCYEYVDKKCTTSHMKCGTNRKNVDVQIYKYNQDTMTFCVFASIFASNCISRG